MMRRRKSDFNVFGIILGVIIGLLVGFFLSGRINFTQTQNTIGDSLQVDNHTLFLLEAGRFEDAKLAQTTYEVLTSKGYQSIVVNERIGKKNFYCIYLDISIKKSDLENQIKKINLNEINLTIRQKSFYDLTSQFLNGTQKKFWDEVIENLFNSLKNKEIILSEEFYISPENIEVFSYFMTLKSLKNEQLKTKYRLEIYRVICETLM